ncbi:DUF3098 domain-containing protein [Portibacter lacus]|uniref:DUF3098 domain-containing protein n=1 Tax=Portibacter lacus TaxID=1099794 RepID=A0AA37SUL8_9BACT|nr:DUF3098 domain-containing protein [Portibacter lacus]GLR20064.1 hypothetical protein GCM10007940_46800 [Portibacter lacus]
MAKKKVVVTTTKNLKPTKSTLGKAEQTSSVDTLSFGRQNYILMLAGIGLIMLGFLLMAGGHMPSPDVWDESIIYSTRRTLIAPIVILAGLVVEIFAIFK